MSYKLQFIHSLRFMASSLSNFLHDLAEEFIKLNVNMDIIIKNVKNVKLNTKIAKWYIEYVSVKDDIIVY